jgi:hypothetical protein
VDHIILENSQEEGLVFDVNELMERLGQLTDPRKARGKRYSFTLYANRHLAGKFS